MTLLAAFLTAVAVSLRWANQRFLRPSVQSRLKWQEDCHGYSEGQSQFPLPCFSATVISGMTDY